MVFTYVIKILKKMAMVSTPMAHRVKSTRMTRPTILLALTFFFFFRGLPAPPPAGVWLFRLPLFVVSMPDNLLFQTGNPTARLRAAYTAKPAEKGISPTSFSHGILQEHILYYVPKYSIPWLVNLGNREKIARSSIFLTMETDFSTKYKKSRRKSSKYLR